MVQFGVLIIVLCQQEVFWCLLGLLLNVFWYWFWQLVGMLFVLLIFSLIVEYVGIVFFWFEEGVLYSKVVMEMESWYFFEEFICSLLLFDLVVMVECWLMLVYQWLFVDSGFLGWLNVFYVD